ncbi:MAG: phosphodiester glycosidase family protein [Bacteroidales bacterium]
MKRLITLLCLYVAVFTANASTPWVLQGNSYAVDTLAHVAVGPGTTHTSVVLSGAYDLTVFYTTTDLTNEYVEIRQIKGGDKVASSGYVSTMAKSKSSDGNFYFAGINADFFSGSTPIGTTIVDDEIYRTNNGDWQAIGVERDGKTPVLGTPYISMSATFPNVTDDIYMTGVNTYRDVDNLLIFTPRFGTSTGTNSYGGEVALVPVNDGDKIGIGSIKMKVYGSVESYVGDMTIPTNGCVMSAHGTMLQYITDLEEGDEVTLNFLASFDNGESVDIIQSLGGCPMILSDGVVLDTEGAIDHLVALNPRTAVGHNADKTKLVMLVVDGRSSISDGCVSKVLADIMRETGCTEAMNFDGGGSSTMYVEALGVVNVPSDGTERAVTNGLYVVSNSPDDDNISEIKFVEESKTLPKYGYYTPVIYGYNQYGVLIDTDVKGFILSADSALGVVQNNGESFFCNGEGTGYLTATYSGITTSIPIVIGEGEVSFRLSDIIEDGYSGYTVEVFSEIDGASMPLDNQALTWWSDDASIATVGAADGLVMGVADGETVIRAEVGDFEGALNVTVEKPTSRSMAIDPDMDITTWTLAQVGGSGIVAEAMENGMKLTYTGASGRSNYIRLTKSVQLWSLPDTLRLRINPGDAPITSVTYTLTNGSGTISTYAFDATVNSNEINVLDLPINDWCDASDRSNYPITISQIQFGMGTSTTGAEYVIEIPGMECVYEVMPATVKDIVTDTAVSTLTPNPIKVGECATLTSTQLGELSIAIYSEAGVKMDAFMVEKSDASVKLPTSKLGAGIYIVAISSAKEQSVAKLMVK